MEYDSVLWVGEFGLDSPANVRRSEFCRAWVRSHTLSTEYLRGVVDGANMEKGLVRRFLERHRIVEENETIVAYRIRFEARKQENP